MVQVEDLHFHRHGEAILAGVGFKLEAGSSTALIGPSGCGKTSLLHLLAGLLKPSAGKIRIAGQNLEGPRPRSAIILQHLGLFPWKTVRENLALGQLSSPEGPDQKRIGAMMDRLGLSGHDHKYPHQLSGGERQRVAIGRSLLVDPDLLLMDEAASALDALSRERLQDLLLDLWQESGLTLLLVTHSIEEAVMLGRHLLIMDHHGNLTSMDNPVDASPVHPRQHLAFNATCQELRACLSARGASA